MSAALVPAHFSVASASASPAVLLVAVTPEELGANRSGFASPATRAALLAAAGGLVALSAVAVALVGIADSRERAATASSKPPEEVNSSSSFETDKRGGPQGGFSSNHHTARVSHGHGAMSHLLTSEAGFFIHSGSGAWLWTLKLEDGGDALLAQPRGSAVAIALAVGLPLVRLRAFIPELLWPSGSLAAAVGRPAGLAAVTLDAGGAAYAEECRRLWFKWARGCLQRRTCDGKASSEHTKMLPGSHESRSLAALSRKLAQSRSLAHLASGHETSLACSRSPVTDDDTAATLCGTALVLAHATQLRLLVPDVLEERIATATAHFAAPGALPHALRKLRWGSFPQLYRMFIAALGPAGRLTAPGEEWQEIAHMWRILLLQRTDGAWDATPALAAALHARCKPAALCSDAAAAAAVCPLATDVSAIRRTMPPPLRPPPLLFLGAAGAENGGAECLLEKTKRLPKRIPELALEGTVTLKETVSPTQSQELSPPLMPIKMKALAEPFHVVPFSADLRLDIHRSGACRCRRCAAFNSPKTQVEWGLPLNVLRSCANVASESFDSTGYEPSEVNAAPNSFELSKDKLPPLLPLPPSNSPQDGTIPPTRTVQRQRLDPRKLRVWSTLLATSALAESPFQPVLLSRHVPLQALSPYETPLDLAAHFLESRGVGDSAADTKTLRGQAKAVLDAWSSAQNAVAAASLHSHHVRAALPFLSRHAHTLVVNAVGCTRCRHDTMSALLAPRSAALARTHRVSAALVLLLASVTGASVLRALRAAGCCAEARSLLACSSEAAEPCRGVESSCAALVDVFLGVQDSGLVSYSCTRFPNPDSPRDQLLAGLLVSIGTALVSGTLGRAARAHTRAATARFAGDRLRVAELDANAAQAAAMALRVAAPAWRDTLLTWRWRVPLPEATAAAAVPPRLVRVSAYLSLASSPFDTAVDALAALAVLVTRPVMIVYHRIASLKEQKQLPSWALLSIMLWSLLVGLTLGAVTLIAVYEGAPAVWPFLLGVSTAVLVDQVVQWRDVYQELFQVLVAQLAAELFRLKAAPGLFGEVLDYFSTQSFLFSNDDHDDDAAEAGRVERPIDSEAHRSGVGQVMVLWLASRAVGEE